MTFMQRWALLLIGCLLVLGIFSVGFIPLLLVAAGTAGVSGVGALLVAGKHNQLK